jgi:hypothetical protein
LIEPEFLAKAQTFNMKLKHLFIISLLCLRPSHAAIIVDWGSSAASQIMNSTGTLLAVDSYTFQLGVFLNSFTPNATNIQQWQENWTVFDQAAYEVVDLGIFGFASQFSGSAGILGDGTSDSPYADHMLGLNFEGRQAYIWVFNTTIPSSSTEWFLATASTWIFPEGSDESSGPDIEWFLPDLGSETPVWGAQTGNIGAGDYEITDSLFDLQTFKVPEPSSALLFGMGVCGLAFRRKRDSQTVDFHSAGKTR